MKKTTPKKTTGSKPRNTSRLPKTLRLPTQTFSEKARDTDALTHEIPESARDTSSEALPVEMPDSTDNWSEPQDRSEDLARLNDPFIQEPERDTEIPPELTQRRTGRILNDTENLADAFDAERESPPL